MNEYPFEDGIDHLLFDDPKPEEYGLDPEDVDMEEWQHAVEVARTVAHAIAEGQVEIEEGEDGEIRFYPVTE